MEKPGHPLSAVPGFPQEALGRLRDQLSVTTVEELVSVFHRSPEAVAKVAGGGTKKWSDIVATAGQRLPAEVVRLLESAEERNYAFATGCVKN